MARGMGGESPSNIMKHLSGISFPAQKEDLVRKARSGEGPDTEEVVDFLERLPNREYEGVQDVTKEIGKIDRGEDNEKSE
jgi:hypothetical protein